MAFSAIAYNVPQLSEGGICKRLVCAAFVLADVSSLVIFSFFRWGAVEFYTMVIN